MSNMTLSFELQNVLKRISRKNSHLVLIDKQLLVIEKIERVVMPDEIKEFFVTQRDLLNYLRVSEILELEELTTRKDRLEYQLGIKVYVT